MHDKNHCSCSFPTNFVDRLLTGGKAAYFSNILRLYKDVWNNNVEVTTSFNNDITFQLEKTLHEPHTALFWHGTDVLNNKNFECKVNNKIWNNGWVLDQQKDIYFRRDHAVVKLNLSKK